MFVRTRITGKNGTYRVVLHVVESHAKVYVICNVEVPESKRDRVSRYIFKVKVNSNQLLRGSLKPDAVKGELKF